MPELSASSQFWMNWWVQFAVAFGTIAAVIAALFGQAIRRRCFPPKLVLTIPDLLGEKATVRIESTDFPQGRSEEARYYRICVSNARRWSPANQVQVVLLRVEEPAANDQFAASWVGEIPLTWTHQQLFPTLRTIGPDTPADFFSVVKNKWLELHPLIVPHHFNRIYRGSAHLILSVQAKSSECDSPILRVRVDWDGQWHDGAQEMQRHLTVKVENA